MYVLIKTLISQHLTLCLNYATVSLTCVPYSVRVATRRFQVLNVWTIRIYRCFSPVKLILLT